MTASFPPVPDQPGYYGQPGPGYGGPPPPPSYGPGQAPGYSPYGPGYGPGYAPGYGPSVAWTVNPVGIALALIGGALALVGGFLDWYTDVVLGDIVNALDVDGADAFPKAYFDWLMWVLLAGAVVTALFACLPIGAAKALRIVSPLVGGLGAVLIFVSLSQLIERGSVLDRSQIGLYATVIGFVLAGVGGVLGPRRTLTP